MKAPIMIALNLSLFILLGLGMPIISFAQTINVFDIVVATGPFTATSTMTVSGSAFSVGGSTLNVNNGRVGIGTSAPAGLFHVIGTAIDGSRPQILWVHNYGALRVGQNFGPDGIGSIALGSGAVASESYASVTGGIQNVADGEASFIGAGGTNLFPNTVMDDRSSVVSGRDNLVTSVDASIVSGWTNLVSGHYGHIGAGVGNVVGGQNGSIVGGYFNVAGDAASDFDATVGGGAYNQSIGTGSVVSGGGDRFVIAGNIASGRVSSILGGVLNQASGHYSAIGGGVANVASGIAATVSGGSHGRAFGDFATVIGGSSNTAIGAYSFAGGRLSSAAAQGSFVWSDSQNSAFTSTSNDEFKIRAQGGFVFYGSTSTASVIVSSNSLLISTSPTSASAVPNLYISSTNGNVGIGTMFPAANVDVNGAGQFGAGSTKSTFTAGGSLQVASTGTFSGQDASGYSLKVSSGINASVGCILLQGGLVCGPSTGSSNSGSPSWTKYTKSYSDFAKAATSSTSSLVTVAAGTVIHGVKIKHSTKFSGGSLTGYTISVGTGPGNSASSVYASAFNVFQVVTSTAIQLSQNFSAEEGSTTWSISANATSTGGNLNAASAGSVDIWLLTSITP